MPLTQPTVSTRIAVVMSGVLVLAGSAQAATVWNDAFDDGSIESTGGLDGDWANTRGGQPQMGVESDGTLGGGNALSADPDGSFSNMIFVGDFPAAATLGPKVGDQLQYRADFRWVAEPATGGKGFRWGIYNSNGTPRSAGKNNVHDDFGYQVYYGTGDDSNTRPLKDPGSGDPVKGGNDINPKTVNTDVQLNDTDPHSLGINLTRQSESLQIEYLLDGEVVATATDDSGDLYTTFDEAAFNTHVEPAPDLHVDNVTMETVPVPEPASLGLLAVGGGLFVLPRRRRG